MKNTQTEPCGRCDRVVEVDELPDFAVADTGFDRLCRWCQLDVVPEQWST